MSFQAYLDNIQQKTGQRPDDIAAALRAQGLAKPGEMVAWLKQTYGLGHGHAMAIVSLARRDGHQPARSADDKVAAHFTGAKARWRGAYDQLAEAGDRLGPDVAVSPGATYLSFVKGGRKFAIVQAGRDRLDVGLKLRGAAAGGRLEDAGSWNAMVTHRVRLTDAAGIDAELLGWLAQAYSGA